MGDKDTGADNDAPATVTLEVKSPSGDVWGTLIATAKEFKTGSLGYYASGKVTNPQSGRRYQIGANVILIGSKK